MKLLGISAYYHDSAAALISNGEILAAAEEERFTRRKHDASFPAQSLRFCLQQTGFQLSEIDAVVFYEKPFLKFERLLETYLSHAPRGLGSYLRAMPVWLKEKLFLKKILLRELSTFSEKVPELLFSEHHLSHAASAFYPSPFSESAVLCLDGVGEWSTSTAWLGTGPRLQRLWEIRFPHSLGLLYSAFTYFTGFKVNSGEYKLMGLAPFGTPRYRDIILKELIDVKEDGSFRLNMDYFTYATGLRMTGHRFAKLFGGPARQPESPITQRERDLAASIQSVTEEIILRLADSLRRQTDTPNLCLAGGVALNCVANGRLQREGPFSRIWIQPAAGDAGGAIGAALAAYHQHAGNSRAPKAQDAMRGSYLGPEFSNREVETFLADAAVPFHYLSDDELFQETAKQLSEQKIVGWFQGRMEFGPRALGNRSILADPRRAQMQSTLNLKTKFRESFRPFAPSVLEERREEFFELAAPSPYMLLVAPVANSQRKLSAEDFEGLDKVKATRSTIAAVTHVDYSARVQTVNVENNPRYHRLISAFAALTGCPVLINTSFNVRGEPIVCTPSDAYRCFMRSEIDTLVLGNYLLRKEEQPIPEPDENWRREYTLD